jgi:small-conductance mechanosensitive channel
LMFHTGQIIQLPNLAGVSYTDIFAALIIMVGGLFIASFTRRFITRLTREVLPVSTRIFVERFAYYTVLVIAGMAALSRLQVDFSGAIIAGGIFGIVVGFASQSVVANLLSGIFLHVDRTIQIGDTLEVIGTEIMGVVTDMTIFSTKIRSFDGTQVRIPNEKVFTSSIRRFTAHSARRVQMQVGIAYGSDITKAISAIREALAAQPLILTDPAPAVFVDRFDESSIVLNVFAWAPVGEFFAVRQLIPTVIKEALDANGIQIPFPQRVVHIVGQNAEKEKQ